MSLKLTKNLNVNQVCSDYGIVLSSQVVSCSLVFKVEAVSIAGGSGTATVSVSVNGIAVGNQQEFNFPYDASGGGVVSQAEAYMLALDDFAGATISTDEN